MNTGPVDDEIRLGVGVALLVADVEEFADSTITPLLPVELKTAVDELNLPLRSPSELVNAEPVEVETRLGVGVALRVADVEEFEDGATTPLLPVELNAAVDELNLPLRSPSEFVKGGPVEVELKRELVVIAGGTTLLPLVETLLDRVGIPLLPIGDVLFALGVEERLGRTVVVIVTVTPLEGAGGMIPVEPVEVAIAVPEDVEDSSESSETMVPTLEAGGGTTPESPVEDVTAVLPDDTALFDPSDAETASRLVSVDTEPELVLEGGTTPESPVPVDVYVLLLVENNAAPEDTDCDKMMEELPVEFLTDVLPVAREGMLGVTVSVTVTVVLRVGDGGMTPESPVELEVSVLPLTANDATPELADTEITTEPPVEELGGMTLPTSVLFAVAVEPDKVTTFEMVDITVVMMVKFEGC